MYVAFKPLEWRFQPQKPQFSAECIFLNYPLHAIHGGKLVVTSCEHYCAKTRPWGWMNCLQTSDKELRWCTDLGRRAQQLFLLFMERRSAVPQLTTRVCLQKWVIFFSDHHVKASNMSILNIYSFMHSVVLVYTEIHKGESAAVCLS